MRHCHLRIQYIYIYIYNIYIGNWNVCSIKIMYNVLYSSNTLAPWRCCSNCEGVISEHISRIKFAKPLPEPIMIQIYVAIWLEQTTVCWTKVDLNDPLYTENPLYTEYLSYCKYNIATTNRKLHKHFLYTDADCHFGDMYGQLFENKTFASTLANTLVWLIDA